MRDSPPLWQIFSGRYSVQRGQFLILVLVHESRTDPFFDTDAVGWVVVGWGKNYPAGAVLY